MKERFLLVVVLSLIATINGFTLARDRCRSKTTFFGGFGFGESSSTPSQSRKKNKGKRLANELLPNGNTTEESSLTRETLGAEKKVDKWGLPIQTEEEILQEIFPLMSKETEMIPAYPGKEYTLPEIQDCLRNHIDLNLGRLFDENGAAKQLNEAKPIQLRLLHQSPPVLAIENLFSGTECQKLRNSSLFGHEVSSATFAGSLSTRTSTSWFCNYADVPLLLAKVNQYLNIPLGVMEEPQIVRYQKGEEFSWHYDTVPTDALENGGQRLATLLVYLSNVPSDHGGGTMFRDLAYDSEPLVVQPKLGSALLFFPAKSDGTADERTLHRSEVMTGDDEKWIIQMWIHEREYKAVLPIGNSHDLAGDAVRETIVKLGFVEDQ